MTTELREGAEATQSTTALASSGAIDRRNQMAVQHIGPVARSCAFTDTQHFAKALKAYLKSIIFLTCVKPPLSLVIDDIVMRYK